MRWSSWPDPATFLTVARPYLREAPLVNQMPFGVALALLADPLRYGGATPRLHTVHIGEACVGAVVQTPPRVPSISRMSPEVAAFAGAQFAAAYPDELGVFGPDVEADAFLASMLLARGGTAAGGPAVSEEGMGLFELNAVEPVPRAEGRRRPVAATDGDHLHLWLQAFHDEAVPEDPALPPGAGALVAARGTGHYWVDDAGTPVAYAGFGRVLEGYVSVGPVYTPPEHRGHGYATALVAEMSALALAEGRVGCTLFTNLANPTSNRIYQRIGYRRIGTMKRCFLPA